MWSPYVNWESGRFLHSRGCSSRVVVAVAAVAVVVVAVDDDEC